MVKDVKSGGINRGPFVSPPTTPKAQGEAAAKAPQPKLSDLPKHFPQLSGKPSIIQQAAWQGAQMLASKYYGGGQMQGSQSSHVVSFIANAMSRKPGQVLDQTTRQFLVAGLKKHGLPQAKVEQLVETLAEAVAARMGYTPPLSSSKLDDVTKAIELMKDGELAPLFDVAGAKRREAAWKIAELMNRLLGRAEDDEEEDASDEDPPEPEEPEVPEDLEGAYEETALPPENLARRLAELHALAPDLSPVLYRSVLEFAAQLADLAGVVEGEEGLYRPAGDDEEPDPSP